MSSRIPAFPLPESGAPPIEARPMHVYISIVAPVPPPSLVDRLTQHIRTHRGAWSSALLAVAGGLSALAGALALVDSSALGPRGAEQTRRLRVRAIALPPPSENQLLMAFVVQGLLNKFVAGGFKRRPIRRGAIRADTVQMITSAAVELAQKKAELPSFKGGGELEPRSPAPKKPPRR